MFLMCISCSCFRFFGRVSVIIYIMLKFFNHVQVEKIFFLGSSLAKIFCAIATRLNLPTPPHSPTLARISPSFGKASRRDERLLAWGSRRGSRGYWGSGEPLQPSGVGNRLDSIIESVQPRL